MTTPLHEKAFLNDESKKLPRPFILRRLHSVLGLWLAIYLFEHLLVNSQIAFYFQDDGYSFISMVNKIHSIPFLKVVELLFLGLPFFIHGVWGILYLWTGKFNSSSTDGTKPALPQYKRNRAYSWQRITSWVLVVGIIAHVVQMRFLDYPILTYRGEHKYYTVGIKDEPQLKSVAANLQVDLFDRIKLQEFEEELKQRKAQLEQESDRDEAFYRQWNEMQEEQEWYEAATKKKLGKEKVLAVAPSAGTAFLLILREVFRSPLMVILYSVLVVAAAYHAFNGLWTFMITWGVTLSRRSQWRMKAITNTLMGVVTLLGLMAIWGTYWTVMFQK